MERARLPHNLRKRCLSSHSGEDFAIVAGVLAKTRFGMPHTVMMPQDLRMRLALQPAQSVSDFA